MRWSSFVVLLATLILCLTTAYAAVSDTDMDTPVLSPPVVTQVTVTTSSTERLGATTAKSGRAAGRAFWPAFVSSLVVIILAELGDKTFFIAAVSPSFLLPPAFLFPRPAC
jgi:hypothetical protein